MSSRNVETRIEVPTLRSFVLVSENEMPERLQAWFDAHKTQWARVDADALKDGGPWWLVPSWTQPLFEAAGHQVSPKEALIAAALGQVLTAQPRLTLNAQNVAYLLSRLEGAGFKRTVAEALASRGGLDGLVEDLCALVARGYPLVNLEYVLDSLAAYPRSQFSSTAVAEDVEKDQTAATLRGGVRFAGAHGATAEAAKSVPAEEIVPYRDTADRKAGAPQPLRVYLGDDLVDYFATPEGELQPKILGAMADLRGELFKRFGIEVPGVRFKGAISDPTRKLAPKAFRVELLTQTWADRDAIAIEVPASPCASSTGCSAASSFGRRPASTACNWCGHCKTPRRRGSRPTRNLRPHRRQWQSSRESTPSSNAIFRAPSSGLARRWRQTDAVPLRAFPRPTQVATP